MRWQLAMVIVFIAGCADESATDPHDDPFDDIDAGPVASDKGVIRGIVLDPTITPIAGATVGLQDGQETTTGEDGIFLFSDLEPGVHFITASKPGYTQVQQSTDVVAGQERPPVVKVQLVALPGTEPRAQTYQDEGFIACGWGVPITYGYCGQYIDAEDDYRLQYQVAGTPSFVQVEVIWRNTQPLSENLYMINSLCPEDNKDSCPGTIAAGRRWDEGTWTSPAIMRTPPGFVEDAMEQFDAEDTNGWWVGVDVSADGPALATGATIDQEFHGYVTMFWNIEPSQDWTFVEHGEYPVPE